MAVSTVKLNGTTLMTVNDTTAHGPDVLAGKYFYGADGLRRIGSGSGAENIVQGSFTLTDETAGPYRITVPYHGTGFPIAAMIYVSGGPYNQGTDFYSTVSRYAVSCWMLCKSGQDLAPTYQVSGAANYGLVVGTYKSSATSATTYNRHGGQSINAYSSSEAGSGQATYVAKFINATTLSVYMKTPDANVYGFLQGIPYDYIVVYSE